MPQPRLGAFDALRGIAAAAVVLLHLEHVKLSGPILPHAFFAVDVFFALSGFVIAYTYEDKLARGMPAAEFLMRRAIRLYPMIAFGTCFGALVLALKVFADPGRTDPPLLVATTLLSNLVLLPTPFSTPASHGVLFLSDSPLWSVAFEVFVNLVWCAGLVRTSLRTLAVIVGLCTTCFALIALREGTTDIGYDWTSAADGFARVGCGFGIGVLAYRLRGRLAVTRGVAPKVASVLVLLGAFAVPELGRPLVAVEIACVILLMPTMIVLALNSEDHAVDRLLGECSYPLYAIHFPFLLLASGLHQTLPRLSLWVLVPGTLVVTGLASAFITRWYDAPMRHALASRWARRDRGRSASPGGPAARGDAVGCGTRQA